MSDSIESPASPCGPPPPPWLAERSIWQEVESGRYRADLAAWSEICAGSNTPIVDLGCGTGRVAGHLATESHRVIGIEQDPGIAADFRRLNAGTSATVMVGDVLALDHLLPTDQRFDRILLPQQLIQIIGDAERRSRLLTMVHNRLTAKGIAAFALVPELPETSLELDLAPDLLEVEGWLFTSKPVSIEAAEDLIDLTRVRTRTSPEGKSDESTSVTTFHRLDPLGLAQEAKRADMALIKTIEVPTTTEHAPSVICVCRRG